MVSFIGMTYRWSCKALDGSDISCLEDGSALAPSIIVHGADLIEGKSYKYTVTIERSGRTAADSKVVTVHNFNLQLHCNCSKHNTFSNVQASIFQHSLLREQVMTKTEQAVETAANIVGSVTNETSVDDTITLLDGAVNNLASVSQVQNVWRKLMLSFKRPISKIFSMGILNSYIFVRAKPLNFQHSMFLVEFQHQLHFSGR